MNMLSSVMMLILLVAAPGLCTAQQGAEEMPRVIKTAAQQITGKVTQVDAKAKTFTVVTQGKTYTIGAAKLRSLPTVGDIVEVTYTVTPGGLMEGSNLNLSKSNVD
jgi:hypothetical protein